MLVDATSHAVMVSLCLWLLLLLPLLLLPQAALSGRSVTGRICPDHSHAALAGFPRQLHVCAGHDTVRLLGCRSRAGRVV